MTAPPALTSPTPVPPGPQPWTPRRTGPCWTPPWTSRAPAGRSPSVKRRVAGGGAGQGPVPARWMGSWTSSRSRTTEACCACCWKLLEISVPGHRPAQLMPQLLASVGTTGPGRGAGPDCPLSLCPRPVPPRLPLPPWPPAQGQSWGASTLLFCPPCLLCRVSPPPLLLARSRASPQPFGLNPSAGGV